MWVFLLLEPPGTFWNWLETREPAVVVTLHLVFRPNLSLALNQHASGIRQAAHSPTGLAKNPAGISEGQGLILGDKIGLGSAKGKGEE